MKIENDMKAREGALKEILSKDLNSINEKNKQLEDENLSLQKKFQSSLKTAEDLQKQIQAANKQDLSQKDTIKGLDQQLQEANKKFELHTLDLNQQIQDLQK